MGQHCEAFQPYPFSSSFFSFFRKPKMNLLISISTLCFVSLVAGIPAKAYEGAKDFDLAEEMDEVNRQKDGGPPDFVYDVPCAKRYDFCDATRPCCTDYPYPIKCRMNPAPGHKPSCVFDSKKAGRGEED